MSQRHIKLRKLTPRESSSDPFTGTEVMPGLLLLAALIKTACTMVHELVSVCFRGSAFGKHHSGSSESLGDTCGCAVVLRHKDRASKAGSAAVELCNVCGAACPLRLVIVCGDRTAVRGHHVDMAHHEPQRAPCASAARPGTSRRASSSHSLEALTSAATAVKAKCSSLSSRPSCAAWRGCLRNMPCRVCDADSAERACLWRLDANRTGTAAT